MRCVYEIVRIFTSFATIVTSISGQSFIQSAKTVTHVCRRNGYGMHARVSWFVRCHLPRSYRLDRQRDGCNCVMPVAEIVVVDSLASAVLNMGAFIFSLALATIPWIALVVVDPIEELTDTYYIYVSLEALDQWKNCGSL